MIRKNSGLPPRVYEKNGSFYLVTLQNRWVKLCRVSAGLPEMYRQLAKVTDAESTRQLMPAVIARWLDSKRAEWAGKTERDQDRIARTMADAFAEFEPSKVTTPVCAQYLKAFAGTPRTHNLHRTMLRQVIAFAALEGLREGHNPIDNIPTKATPGRRRVVTDEEIKALKAAAMLAPVSGRALVQMIDFALITGQRIGDMIKMRWQDVTEAGLLVDQGKTGAKLLIEWSPALRAAIATCDRGDRIGYIIKSRNGSGYRYAGMRSAWVRACERAGIEDLNIHDLRGRAGVDVLLASDEDTRQAQRLLGHKTEAMTRHYTDGKYAKRVKPAR